jgi:hypothetical protein
MTPAERTLRARAAAYAQWAAEPDWTARTAKARAGLAARFERLAREKHPDATGPELAKYAEVERRRFYADMALKSARARRQRSGK